MPAPVLAQAAGLFINAGLAAAGAAAISIPIAIHLLTRMRRTPVRWAAMQFLLEAYRRQRRRLQFEQLLLLILRCLILICLGLALAGPLIAGLASALTGGSLGRTIYLFLDDSLSTRALPPGASPNSPESRFDRLRSSALKIVEAARPEDRIALVTSGRPPRELFAAPTLDHGAVKAALRNLQPRHSAPAWSQTLFTGTLRNVNPSGIDRDGTVVFLLSDFAASTLDLASPAPTEFANVGERARILVTHPMTPVGNVQVAQVTPFRRIVFQQPSNTPVLPVEIRLRRFASQPSDIVTGVTLSLVDADPSKPLASARRDVHWSAGQSQATLNVDLALPPRSGPEAESTLFLTLRATVDAPPGADSLLADNTRAAGIELRSVMSVAVIDDPSGATPSGSPAAGNQKPDAGVAFSPRFWLSLALQPGRPDGPQSIRLSSLEPAAIRADALRTIDAVVVLRPDLLSDTSLLSLRDYAQHGGLILIIAPAQDAPGPWAARLPEKLGLPWQIGLEPLTPQSASSRPASDSSSDASWSLSTSDSAPQALRLLASDWNLLLRPVHVLRRLSIASKGADDQVFLRVDDPARSALLVSSPLGQGRVLFMGTALSADWTDLPTKPLFVPLLHELLEGLLGNPGSMTRSAELTSGDSIPTLGPWQGVKRVVSAVKQEGSASLASSTLAGAGPDASASLDAPGVYLPDPPDASLRVIVNPDPSAGDTRRLDEGALGQWLTRALGNWAWADPDHPEAALENRPTLANLGWPLLWLVLALLVIESFLARYFSHADLPGQTSILSQWRAKASRFLKGAGS